MKGIDGITLERMLLDIERLPDTRKNQSIKECLMFLIDTEPDTDESLKIVEDAL